METLNDGIDYMKEMFDKMSTIMETEQTSKLTDAIMQTEQPMDNTRIFDYILVKQVNKKNKNNIGILKLRELKSLNASNETKLIGTRQS